MGFGGGGVETWCLRIPTMYTNSGLWTEKSSISNVYILLSFQKPVHATVKNKIHAKFKKYYKFYDSLGHDVIFQSPSPPKKPITITWVTLHNFLHFKKGVSQVLKRILERLTLWN